MDDFSAFDVRRMFVGDITLVFLLEVAFRTAFMYSFTFGMARMVARRAIGQLSLIEFLLVIALGSAVGDPMFYPEVPLLHGMVVVAVVVGLNAFFNKLVANVETIETLVEGTPQRVVRDGVLDLSGVRSASLSQEELFEQLRAQGVEQLGQVRAAYLEQSGQVSVFRYRALEDRPGLSIEPPEDLEQPSTFEAGRAAPEAGLYACRTDGAVIRVPHGVPLPKCPCGGERWTPATPGSVDAPGIGGLAEEAQSAL